MSDLPELGLSSSKMENQFTIPVFRADGTIEYIAVTTPDAISVRPGKPIDVSLLDPDQETAK
jgi:hypothetical protein